MSQIHPTTAERREHRDYQRRLIASGVIPPERMSWRVLIDRIVAYGEAFHAACKSDQETDQLSIAGARLHDAIQRFRDEGEADVREQLAARETELYPAEDELEQARRQVGQEVDHD